MSTFSGNLLLSYPRDAQVGKRYAVTVDLEHDPARWSLDTEEYPLRCVIDAKDFSCEADGDAAILLHRFGGSYGPARFVLKALAPADASRVRVTLLDARGGVVHSRALDPIRIEAEKLIWSPNSVHGADDFAISIGLTRYPQVPLRTPGNDARAFHDWFEHPNGGAIPGSRILLIESADDDRFEPTGVQIVASIREVLSKPGRIGRRLYIFASGHGTEIGGAPVFAGADLDNLERSLVDLPAIVLQALDRGSFDEAVLFMNTDRVPFGTTTMQLLRASPPRPVSWLFGFATGSKEGGYEVLDDADRLSPFTRVLLDVLEKSKVSGVDASTFATNVRTEMEERLRAVGLAGTQNPDFEIRGELELLPPSIAPLPPPPIPERDTREPECWVYNVERAVGDTLELVGSPRITRGDLVVVFAKEPVLHPLGIYEVEVGRRLAANDGSGTRGTGARVQCKRVLAFPDAAPAMLERVRSELMAISNSTVQRDTRNLRIHEPLVEILRWLYDEDVGIRVALEYLLIRPLSAREFAVYREQRLGALREGFAGDQREWLDYAHEVEDTSRLARDAAMNLWQLRLANQYTRPHEGLGLSLELRTADIDEIEFVASSDRALHWLHEHLLRHPARSLRLGHQPQRARWSERIAGVRTVAFQSALERLEWATRTDHNQIFILEDDGGMRLAAESIPPEEVRLAKVGKGKGLIFEVLDGPTLNVPDVHSHPEYDAVFAKTRAELVVPVVLERRTVAVLNSEAEREGYFTREMERRVEVLAEHLGNTLEALGYPKTLPRRPAPSPEAARSRDLSARLHSALLDAFPGQAALAEMVAYLGVRLVSITMSLGMDQTVRDVIDWANANGRIAELALAARKASPRNESLASIASELNVAGVAEDGLE